MKGAAANPLCDLAREAPRAWEIKTPLAVEILPVNDLHPPREWHQLIFSRSLFSPFQMPVCLVKRTEPLDACFTSSFFMRAQQSFPGFA